jgi:hypothetical protein
MKQSCIRAGDIQIPEQQQLVTATLTPYLLESTFICIKPQVHIMSEPAAIIILVQRPFSANCAFWLIGPCIMLSPIWMRPTVGAQPSLPEVVLPHI